jgi:hypothetical protein
MNDSSKIIVGFLSVLSQLPVRGRVALLVSRHCLDIRIRIDSYEAPKGSKCCVSVPNLAQFRLDAPMTGD